MSVSQIAADLFLSPAQGAADGAFVYTPLCRDLGDVHLLKIIGDDGLPLKLGQLLLYHPLDPLQLHLPG